MRTAERSMHLTERKAFNSRLYIEVLRDCPTCDDACSLVHMEEKWERLKFTFLTSRWNIYSSSVAQHSGHFRTEPRLGCQCIVRGGCLGGMFWI